jgi:uncharacterized protein (DUF362 family)
MRFKKYSLFYIIGISIYLILNLRGRYVFKLLYLRPKTKKVSPKVVPNVYKEGDKTLISIVQGNDIYTMLKEGIKLLGGFEKLNIKGKSVLIKPNIVNRYESPANTNPLLIKYLIRLLHEYGASQVFVGDMSAIFAFPTKKNAEKSGIWRAIQDEDMIFIPFEKYGWAEVTIPNGKFLKKALVSEVIYQVERIINLPVIKTHIYAHYSIALKNFIGAVHPIHRPFFIAPDFWDEIVAELNAAYTPHLNILDGTKIFIDNGPTKGTVANPNLVVITGDRIAADVTGLGIIKAFGGLKKTGDKNVWEQRQIKRAIELNLGIRDPTELKIVSKCLCTDRFDPDSEKERKFAEMVQKIQNNVNKQMGRVGIAHQKTSDVDK